MQEDGIIAEAFILYYYWSLISENKLVPQQVAQIFISPKILKKICTVCEERLFHEMSRLHCLVTFCSYLMHCSSKVDTLLQGSKLKLSQNCLQ